MATRRNHLVNALLAASISMIAGLGPAVADAKLDSVMATLKSSYPSTNFTSVEYTPYKGMYEVVMGKKIAYTDANGRHFMFGHIFDMDTKRDITGDRKALLNKYEFGDLPLEQAITIKRGTGEKELAVFASPDCPYCVQLEKQLVQINDITVHVFLMSRGTQEGDKLSRQIWCAEDPGKSWIDFMTKQIAPSEPTGKCEGFDKASQVVTQFSRENKIMGTPFLIGKNGKSTPGMPNIVKLNELLKPVENIVARVEQ